MTDLTSRWSCQVVGPAWHGQVALVFPVESRGGPAALKVSFPHPGNLSEAGALRSFAGSGAVRLLNADEDRFALLLEHAGPRALSEGPSTDHAVEVMGVLARRLAVPAAPSSPTLADTADGWAEQLRHHASTSAYPLPPGALERALATIDALGDDATPTLIHGDLHPGNVLTAQREPWLAIDPKGQRGSAAYDAFTAVAGRRATFPPDERLSTAIPRLIDRFAAAADVDTTLALACCQARATSSLLHQDLVDGGWFDLEVLETFVALRP